MRKVFFLVLRLCITVGILYYLFTKIPFSEVIASVTSAKVSYVLIAFLIQVFIRYIAACRMKLLTERQGMSLSVSHILGITFSTIFYGLFLPGGTLTGGVIRWYKLSKPDNKPAEALASAVFDRMVDTIIMCTLGILFWLLDKPSSSSFVGLILAIVLGGLIIFYLVIFNGNIVSFLGSGNKPIKFSFIPRVVHSKVHKLIRSLNQFHNLSKSSLAFILTLSIAYHLFGILSFYLFALSLNMNISFITIAWIRSALLILAMLPISISGLGVREGTLVFLLGPYGVSAADAIAFSFLLLSAFLGIGVIGGLFEVKVLFFPSKNKSEIKEVNRGLEGG